MPSFIFKIVLIIYFNENKNSCQVSCGSPFFGIECFSESGHKKKDITVLVTITLSSIFSKDYTVKQQVIDN